MGAAHPVELRRRLVEAHEQGHGGYIVLARRFCVGVATARRWVALYRREGRVDPAEHGGGRTSDVDLAELEAILARHPDANAGEITAEFNRGRRGSKRRHVSSIKRGLKRAGYVVKKNVYVRSSNSGQT